MASNHADGANGRSKGGLSHLPAKDNLIANRRQALPCFDQPDLKATWEVTLITDKNLTALSNMDVKSEKTLDNGKKVTLFNKTPLMSTYVCDCRLFIRRL